MATATRRGPKRLTGKRRGFIRVRVRSAAYELIRPIAIKHGAPDTGSGILNWAFEQKALDILDDPAMEHWDGWPD
jgi:hypothetical protein